MKFSCWRVLPNYPGPEKDISSKNFPTLITVLEHKTYTQTFRINPARRATVLVSQSKRSCNYKSCSSKTRIRLCAKRKIWLSKKAPAAPGIGVYLVISSARKVDRIGWEGAMPIIRKLAYNSDLIRPPARPREPARGGADISWGSGRNFLSCPRARPANFRGRRPQLATIQANFSFAPISRLRDDFYVWRIASWLRFSCFCFGESCPAHFCAELWDRPHPPLGRLKSYKNSCFTSDAAQLLEHAIDVDEVSLRGWEAFCGFKFA